jgi:pimeloyl-ACP methyl ester carboxylesterase
MNVARKVRRLTFLLLASMLVYSPATAKPIGMGAHHSTAHLPGLPMSVFTYRPKCPNPGLLLVFHGVGRNAEGYRDDARGLGDGLCMIVVAPLFDEERFPSWRYQRGGIIHKGKVQDQRDWTGQLVLDLVAWVRRREGRTVPYSLIGHSAGGQILSRVAAFTPTEAKRIVIANPSTHVFASLKIDAPFGFGGVYPRRNAEAELRRYLETPVTILVGREDVGDKNRNDSAEARAQGKTRYDRGLKAYRTARALAQSNGWSFNWRLIEVPGVGHSAAKMFSAREALDAFSP